jgi:hypothetical protein
MLASKNMPDNYHHQKTLNLSTARTVLWLNLAAIPLLFLYGWLFTQLIIFLRPFNPFQNGFLGFFNAFSLWELLAFLLSIIIMLILHELVHGIFFLLFTRERPKFALKTGYAFTAAPEWYLPSLQYIIVGLSPFVIISFTCIFLAWFIDSTLIPYLLIIAIFNAAGALGDMIVVGWIIKQPKNILVKDEGDIFSSYAPDKLNITK